MRPPHARPVTHMAPGAARPSCARLLAVLACALLSPAAPGQDFSRPGPFQVAQREVTVARTNSTGLGALLFYPAEGSTSSALPDRRAAPCPVISFGHGYLAPPSLYAGTMRHLASWGFVVIAAQSGLEWFPNHKDYADDLRLCLRWAGRMSSEPGGVWHGFFSTNRWGVSGHSMGGGAGILAAADDPAIRAVANLAAAETRPSAIAAVARIRAPVCLIAGGQDAIAPTDRHAGAIYDRAVAPRLLPVIRGGSHCGFVDVPLPALLCDEGSLPRPAQLAQSRALLTAFFRLYLRDEVKAWPLVWGPPLALNLLIQLESDPGFSLDPPLWSRNIRPGESATYHLTLANTGPAPARYLFEASGNVAGLAISPGQTGLLQPGATVSVSVSAALPPNQHHAFTVISVRPDDDPRTRDSVVLGQRGR